MVDGGGIIYFVLEGLSLKHGRKKSEEEEEEEEDKEEEKRVWPPVCLPVRYRFPALAGHIP